MIKTTTTTTTTTFILLLLVVLLLPFSDAFINVSLSWLVRLLLLVPLLLTFHLHTLSLSRLDLSAGCNSSFVPQQQQQHKTIHQSS